MTDRDRLVLAICCSLPANGHSQVYLSRCEHLSLEALNILYTHLRISYPHRHSHACVWALSSPVHDRISGQRDSSDRLCVLWRNGQPRTFYFTRVNQVSRARWDVDEVYPQTVTLLTRKDEQDD